MPALTVDTSPQSQSQSSRAHSPHTTHTASRSASPVRPPVSPITPTIGHARLATATSSNPSPPSSNKNSSSHAGAPPRQTYTHSQPPQTAITQPPPVPIKLDENTDALALKSAMSILQLQARNAENDIRRLAGLKERALRDPEGFMKAADSGELQMKGDRLFNPSAEDEEDDDDEDEEMEEANGEQDTTSDGKEKPWGKLPGKQTVVRCPPINWQKYAVVGESLDKLHADQTARPTEGMPQVLGLDGKLRYGGDGPRRAPDLGIAAPYQPGRDKIDKMGTRRGGKR